MTTTRQPPTIIVARKNHPLAHYIGRPTPLGNPFVIGGEWTRDIVCDRYEKWFHIMLAKHNDDVLRELERLLNIADQELTLILGCYCAPLRCHGDTIKKWLDHRFKP